MLLTLLYYILPVQDILIYAVVKTIVYYISN